AEAGESVVVRVESHVGPSQVRQTVFEEEVLAVLEDAGRSTVCIRELERADQSRRTPCWPGVAAGEKHHCCSKNVAFHVRPPGSTMSRQGCTTVGERERGVYCGSMRSSGAGGQASRVCPSLTGGSERSGMEGAGGPPDCYRRNSADRAVHHAGAG